MTYVIGVDIGATNLRVAIADDSGNFIKYLSEPTVREGSGLSLTAQVIHLIKEVMEKAKVSLREIKGIGIGSIGPLDLRRGAIVNTPNLPFDYVPLVKPLKEKLGKPVTLLNDCTTAVVGERYFGAGRNLNNLAYITISTGIGGGAYVDGNLLIGKDGNAVEIGHTVIDIEGRLTCSCGRKGHWEAYCSGSGIPKFVCLEIKRRGLNINDTMILKMVKGDLTRITAKTVFEAAKRKDDFALEMVSLIGKYNAIGIANVISAYDPSLISIGGSVALKNESLIFPPIRDKVGEFTVNRVPKIIPTPLRDNVVLFGAIALALGLEDIKSPWKSSN